MPASTLIAPRSAHDQLVVKEERSKEPEPVAPKVPDATATAKKKKVGLHYTYRM